MSLFNLSIAKFSVLLGVFVVLSGCGHTPVTRTLIEAFSSGQSVSGVALNPKYEYLRVVFEGNEALLVLGYAEPHPLAEVQTWYSSAGEVIKIQSGRIIASQGFPIDWLSVRYQDLPDWKELKASKGATFTRIRDQMPGYKFGIEDRIVIRKVVAPVNALMKGIDASSLLWFEETVQGSPANLPSARYALKDINGKLSVVYGEQCFDFTQCMAWQTWPAQP